MDLVVNITTDSMFFPPFFSSLKIKENSRQTFSRLLIQIVPFNQMNDSNDFRKYSLLIEMFSKIDGFFFIKALIGLFFEIGNWNHEFF